MKNPVEKYSLDLLDEIASKKCVDGREWMDHIQRVTSKDGQCHFTVTFKSTEKMKITRTKGPVPLERIAVAITSDYEIPAFLGIRR